MNIKNQKLHGLDLQNERENQGDRFDIDEYLKKYENIIPKCDCRGERTDENGNAEAKTVPTLKKHKHAENNMAVLSAVIIIILFMK